MTAALMRNNYVRTSSLASWTTVQLSVTSSSVPTEDCSMMMEYQLLGALRTEAHSYL